MEAGDRQQCSDECREALLRLGAFLDGELGSLTSSQLEEHLAECEPCTDRRAFEEGFRALVRQGCADEAPPALRARILAQLDELTAS